MNVDRCRWGTSAVRARILAAALALSAVGCAILGFVPRSSHTAPAHTASLIDASTMTGSSGLRDHSDSANTAQLSARSLISGLPLVFEPNQGQGNLNPSDSRAKFVARGSGYGLFLGSEGATLTLQSRDRAKPDLAQVNIIEMRLSGGDSSTRLTAVDLLPGRSNYFIGNNPSKWRVGVPQFGRVRYENVYPGINLVFYGNRSQLEYDFQVAPGADPAQAELEFRGAEKIQINDGALLITAGQRTLELEAPRVYQQIAGEKRPVEGKFVLRGANRAGFSLGAYDRSRELIIDPILNFSTYFGGSGDERATSVAVDGSFNIYLAGSTTSPDLPTVAGLYQTTLKGSGPNVYIAKVTPPSGSVVASLSYVTYLGGSGSDSPAGIRVDGGGHPFVAGTTSSGDFPTTATAYQTTPASAGKQHVFVTELAADATSLLYSTYISGNGTDLATGMTINAAGNVFITGTTTSQTAAGQEFPATSPPQGTPFQSSSHAAPGQPQFFVTQVNPIASGIGSILYSTYFGGGSFSSASPIAVGGGIAVDSSNNVYFSGTTNYSFSGCVGCGTTDFPILNAYQPCLDTAPPANLVNPTCSNTTSATESDAFVAKLNLNPNVAQGSQLIWSTYVGGTGTDSSTGVALDPGAANVYIVGTTDSTDIASSVTTLSTSASFQRCLDTPMNPVAGTACTAPTSPAPTDAFVARLSNPAASSGSITNVALNYFSYLGGTADDAGSAIAVDNGSGALITGWTASTDFPVAPASNPIQSSPGGGGQDAFVARLYTGAVVGQNTTASWSSYFGGSDVDAGTGIALDVNQSTYLAGETKSPVPTLQTAKPLTAAQGGGYKGGYDAFVAQLGVAFSLSISGSLTQGTNQQGLVSAGNQATFTYTIQNSGPDLANNITITDNLSSTVTGVPLTFNSASISSGTCGGGSTNAIVSCSLPSLQAGSTATLTIVVTPTGTPSGSQQAFNGGTVQVTAPGAITSPQLSLPATMSDFSMSVSPLSQTVASAGSTAFYTVSLSPHPLYASSITISCSNLPTGASCAPTPSSTTLQGASGSSITLGITTTARPVTTGSLNFVRRNFYALWLVVPGFLLIGIRGDRCRRRIAGILTLCALSTMILLIPACSHSSTQTPVSGTPAGNYTVTVTASSGTNSKTQTVGLVVP